MSGVPEPGETSDAPWFHDMMHRIAAARRAGDDGEVQRLLDLIGQEGNARLRRLAETAIAAAEETEAAHAEGRPQRRIDVGMNLPDELLCDFCASTTVIAFFPFAEFTLEGAGGDWSSGDRMYVCPRCKRYVEAGDWKGLREWVGPGARNPGVRLLWLGFKANRTGPAVPIEPGTNPEAGRPAG